MDAVGRLRGVDPQVGERPVRVALVDADEALQLDVAFELVRLAAGPEDRAVVAARMRRRGAVGPVRRVGGPYDELADEGFLHVPFGKQSFPDDFAVVG